MDKKAHKSSTDEQIQQLGDLRNNTLMCCEHHAVPGGGRKQVHGLKSRSRRCLLWTALASAAFLTACNGNGGGSGGAQGDSNPPAPQQSDALHAAVAKPLGKKMACPNMRASLEHAAPGTVITLTGVPKSLGEPSIRVIAQTPNGKRIDPLFVHAGAPDRTAIFTTPLYPTQDPEGGNVQLELGDGEHHCPQLAFTIDPLPDAPTDYAQTIQTELEQWVDKTLGVLGYNSATLLNADPKTLPKAELSLWVAKQFVSSDRPGALPALADKAAKNPNLDVERLLMASGLEGDLDRALTALDSVPVGMREPAQASQPAKRTATLAKTDSSRALYSTAAAPAAQRVAATAEPPAPAAFKLNGTCEEQAFDPDKLMIADAQELSTRMKNAAKGDVFDASNTGTLLADASYLDSGSTADNAGIVVFVVTTVQAARRALEPQEITQFKVGRVDQRWIEDRPPNPPAFWSQAQVYAKGKSFNLAKPILNGLITAVGAVPGPIGIAAGADAAVGSPVTNKVVDTLTDGACVRIRAPKYGPINVDNRKWTDSKIIGNTVALVGDKHQKYRGVDIGVSNLQVKLKSDEFAEPRLFSQRFPITVEPIRVSTQAPPAVQQPGETIQVSATATNATTDPANFSAAPAGPGSIISAGSDGDFYNVQFQTPAQPNQYPTGVKFVWQGRTLPMGTERSGTAQVVTGGKVTIDQRAACLLPGGSLSLSAQLDGFGGASQSVTWTTTAGQITHASGLTATLVAPGQPATVTVTVTVDSDPSVKDTATYNVAQSCIKKAWVFGAVLTADGNGLYAQGVCGDSEPEEQRVVWPAPGSFDYPAPPTVPPVSQLWVNRTESVSRSFSHSSTRKIADQNDNCSSISLTGSNNSSVTYTGKPDGTLEASMNADLTSVCKKLPDGRTGCAHVETHAETSGFYYLTVSNETDYHLSGELDCSNIHGDASLATPGGFTGVIVRYPGGMQAPDDGSGIRNLDGSRRSPQLFKVSCTPPDDTVPINVDFKLAAPSSGQSDLAVLQIMGGIEAGDPQYLNTPAYDFQPIGAGGFTPQPPVLNPPTGLHHTTANFDFSIKLSPR